MSFFDYNQRPAELLYKQSGNEARINKAQCLRRKQPKMKKERNGILLRKLRHQINENWFFMHIESYFIDIRFEMP